MDSTSRLDRTEILPLPIIMQYDKSSLFRHFSLIFAEPLVSLSEESIPRCSLINFSSVFVTGFIDNQVIYSGREESEILSWAYRYRT